MEFAYYRPWIFMITDGEPQGEPDEAVEQASQRCRVTKQVNVLLFLRRSGKC